MRSGLDPRCHGSSAPMAVPERAAVGKGMGRAGDDDGAVTSEGDGAVVGKRLRQERLSRGR
jgi:hypothetical protein